VRLQGLAVAIAGTFVWLSASLSLAAPGVFSKDEQRLRKAVSDVEMCFHFAGEFSGDGSARDKEIARTQREVCKKDGQRLVRQAYEKNPSDQRLYPAVLMLDSLTSESPLPAAQKARLCAAAKTELVCP